jgi:hypothetical protein
MTWLFTAIDNNNFMHLSELKGGEKQWDALCRGEKTALKPFSSQNKNFCAIKQLYVDVNEALSFTFSPSMKEYFPFHRCFSYLFSTNTLYAS